MNKTENNLALSEFLNHFDFGFRIFDSDGTKEIALVDRLGADLGGIQDERYNADEQGLASIVERLDAYYQDYIFDDLMEKLEKDYGIKEIDDSDWKSIYKKAKEMKIGDYMDILPILFGEKKLMVDEMEAEKESLEGEEDLEL